MCAFTVRWLSISLADNITGVYTESSSTVWRQLGLMYVSCEQGTHKMVKQYYWGYFCQTLRLRYASWFVLMIIFAVKAVKNHDDVRFVGCFLPSGTRVVLLCSPYVNLAYTASGVVLKSRMNVCRIIHSQPDKPSTQRTFLLILLWLPAKSMLLHWHWLLARFDRTESSLMILVAPALFPFILFFSKSFQRFFFFYFACPQNDNLTVPETSPSPEDIERAEQLKNEGDV